MHRIAWLVLATALRLIAGDVNEELLTAARKGDLTSVKALIDKGAVLETKTAYGQTPLYLAAMNGHEVVVEFLLDKGASTEVRDTFYKSPMLGFAIGRKHYGVAKLLISKGAGSADENLAAAARAGNADLVQVALDKAKPSQSSLDKSYETALDRKQADVAAMLKKAGARDPAPAVQVDAKVLEAYSGTYRSEQFPIDVKVFVKEGAMHMQAGGQPEIVPKAKTPTVFEFSPAGLEIEFDSPASFTLKQGAMTAKFKKAGTQ